MGKTKCEAQFETEKKSHAQPHEFDMKPTGVRTDRNLSTVLE